jgi:hypothetical protein
MNLSIAKSRIAKQGKVKRTASFVEAFAVPLSMASRGHVCCVRLWKVDVVPVSVELLLLLLASFLRGLLGAAFLCATLCGTLCRCFLATFFSCHRLLLLLFSLMFSHKIVYQVSTCGLE